VKWVDKIVVSPKESDAHWQQKDYKGFQPATDWATVQWDAAPAIQDMPVTSAILEPTPDAAPIADDEVTVKGYAWSGNGRSVVRVDVSADGGATWTTAALDETPTGRVPVSASASAAAVVPVAQWPSRTSTQGPLAARAWAWTQWQASVPITNEMRARACASTAAAASKRCQVELISRAVDSAYNTQPDSVAPIWNLRGVVNNAWHRVSVEVAPPAPK
jgi:sulfite oxidase